MKFESPKYEFPIAGSAWTHQVELGAGIYFLDGRTHVAGHSSAAERYLLENGALLIATLRFDDAPLEGRLSGRAVRSLGVLEAAQKLGVAHSRS